MLNEVNLKVLTSKLLLLVFILIFVMGYSVLFGSVNMLMGVAIITGLLMFFNMDIGIQTAQAVQLIVISFVSVGAFTYLSNINLVMGLIIHLVTIFWFMILFTEKIEYKAFLPFMLCYVFAQGTPITSVEYGSRICGLLVGGVLVGIVYYCRHHKSGRNYPSIWEIIRNLDLNSVRFEYAVKMAIGVSTGMLIGNLLQAQKGMWISLTIFSVLQPNHRLSKERAKHRLLGNVIGSVAFIILYVMLPVQYSVIITLALSYIYMFVVEYRFQMIFVTINALNASLVLLDYGQSIPTRLSFILVGACIAIVISKYNFIRE